MSTEKYIIGFETPSILIVEEQKKIRASLALTEKAFDRLTKKTKDFEAAVVAAKPKIATMAASVNALVRSLEAMTKAAEASKKPVQDVGNNVKVGALKNRIAELTQALAALQSQANTAAPALAAVGQGVNLPGQGGGGGGGKDNGAGGATIFGMAPKTFAKRAAGTAALAYGVLSNATANRNRDRRQFMEDASKRITDVRESLTEYATLVGSKDGANNKIVDYATKVALDTSGSVDDAIELITNYEGSAPTGRQKGNIGGMRTKDAQGNEVATPVQAQLEKDMVKIGGQIARFTGIDPKTAGNLVGSIPQYKKINNIDDAAKELAGMIYGLNEGKGDISTLTRGELAQAGLSITSGYTKDLTELGAFIGSASAISKGPSAAGTKYSGFSALVNTQKGEGGYEFLEKSGIANVKGDLAKGRLLKKYIEDNKIVDIGAFLNNEGFNNRTDRASTVGMLSGWDVLEERIKTAYSRPASDVYEKIQGNLKNPLSATRRSQTMIDISEIEQGKATEYIQAARGKVRAMMTSPYMNDPKKPYGGRLNPGGWIASAEDTMSSWLSPSKQTGEEILIDSDMIERLLSGGKKVGVDIAKDYPQLARDAPSRSVENIIPYSTIDPALKHSQYVEASQRILSAGGDPFDGLDAAFEKMMQGGRLIQEGGQAMKNAAGGARGQARPDPADGRVPGRR